MRQEYDLHFVDADSFKIDVPARVLVCKSVINTMPPASILIVFSSALRSDWVIAMFFGPTSSK